MSFLCVSGGLPARWNISISTFQYRRGNRNAYKLQCEQECRGAGSALSTFHKPISADDLGSSGLENRRGAWRESAYLCSITGPNEGCFIPGRMEMYFADKVMPNWQVMVTLGDLFPRFPLAVWGGEREESSFFSSGTDRALKGQTTPQRCSPQCLKGVQHAEMVSAWQSAFPMRTLPDRASFSCSNRIIKSCECWVSKCLDQCKADLPCNNDSDAKRLKD